MGKFDGVLLATDWDGTFYSGKVFEENIEALKYFEENGGKFTVCSGRYSDFLKGFIETVPFNTYSICYNGAFIVNLHTNEILYEGFCDDKLFDIIDDILDARLPYATINVYDNQSSEPTPYTPDEYVKHKNEIRQRKIYKVLMRAENEDDGKFAAREVKSKIKLHDYVAVQSWGLSLEILKRENAKGQAIKRLANALGSKLVVAVGDYENDIDMLEAADIGYAVENAIEPVKAIADKITVSVENSAIAKIIYELEKTL